MKRAFLFTNSPCKIEIKEIITQEDYIVGVDGGINTLEKINLTPHVIIGDFDSADKNNRFLNTTIAKISHDPHKDYTDTELAINYVLDKKLDQIIIVNNMQERIDHVLGVLASLRRLHRKGIRACVIGDKQLFMILEQEVSLTLAKDSIISLIPLSDRVEGIFTKGLLYPLNNGTLLCDRALGVSNVVCEEQITIKHDSGELLLIVNYQEYNGIHRVINS